MALPADVVLIGPAEVADRADIDESDLELLGGVGGAERCGGQRETAATATMFISS